MAVLQQYQKDFIVFAEAGFIAINQGDEDAALKLFKAAEALDPKNILPKIGRGYLHLCKLELKQAAKVFEEILGNDPLSEMAKTLLGLTLSLNPAEVAKGEKLLADSSQKSHDPMIKNLSETALEFVEHFVKKPPSPAQVAPSDKEKKK